MNAKTKTKTGQVDEEVVSPSDADHAALAGDDLDSGTAEIESEESTVSDSEPESTEYDSTGGEDTPTDEIVSDAGVESAGEAGDSDGAVDLANLEETEPAVPKTPGKRLTLKERLAARRIEELGQETPDHDGMWYVLHTYSGYENKVKKTIETRVESLDLGDRVYEIIVPTQEEIEIKNGQRQTVLKKVFPGYVLVRMTLDDETWYTLRNTPGVTGFVNVDNKPVQLEESRVQAILKGMVAEAPKVRVTFSLGDTVRINDGPFADFRGEIDEINQEKGKIRVLVSFFGRETPVELDFLQAERET